MHQPPRGKLQWAQPQASLPRASANLIDSFIQISNPLRRGVAEIWYGCRSEAQHMGAGKLSERRWVRVFFILGLWTLFGIFLASQSGLALSRGEKAYPWYKILAADLSFAYVWAALTPPVLWRSEEHTSE